MHFRYSSIAATIAGMTLLTGIAAGPAQAQQQESQFQGPNGAPNIQNLDSNEGSDSNNAPEAQNVESNEASDAMSNTQDRNPGQARDLVERKVIRSNDFFTRNGRTYVLVPRGPHGAYLPVEQPGFGGPDFLGR